MRTDHVLHFVAAWMLADLIGLLVGADVAFLVVVILAALKEVIWDGAMDKGDPDAIDFLSSVAGAWFAVLWWSGPVLISLWVFWILYVLTMGLYRAKLTGRLKGFSLLLCSPFVAVAFVLDFLAQMTVFTVLFGEWPRELLVTGRLRRLMRGPDGWRRRMADYFCRHLLDPFDPTGGHCDSETPDLKA